LLLEIFAPGVFQHNRPKADTNPDRDERQPSKLKGTTGGLAAWKEVNLPMVIGNR